MTLNYINVNTIVATNGVFTYLALPVNSISDVTVAPDAGIQATKLEHQYELTYGQPNTAATTITLPLHVVRGATATLESICAGSIVAAIGGASVTVDLKKNGTTCLTGVITLDSGNTAYIPEAGVVSVSAAVADAVYTLVITATVGGGTLPTGLFVTVKIREDAD